MNSSAVEQLQMRLQEAMEQGNQALLGQTIYASKGANGLKQLRRSAKARLKQLSADQNREMIGSYMPPEEPLTWRTSEQGDRYRAVAHLSTSIIGWVIGHKGCNARMLKQQTGTELWVDVPGQCVIIVAKAMEELEGGMEAVNSFVKTAPTFIAKVQAGHAGGITQTVQCPVHLLPSIQRLSRKIQVESGANYVFANCKVSTFCVTGDRKNVEDAVAMLKRLIAEGNSEMLTPASGASANGRISSYANGNRAGGGSSGGSSGGRGWPEIAQGLGREGSELSRGRGSPPTAPCSPDDASATSVWGNGIPSSHPLACTWSAQAAATPAHHNSQLRSHTSTASTHATFGNPAPFQSASLGRPSSDLSFFSFGMSDLDAGRLALPGGGATTAAATGSGPARASTAPMPTISDESSMGYDGVRAMLPGLGFLEESAGAGGGLDCADESVHDEVGLVSRGPTSSYDFGEFSGSEANGLSANFGRSVSTGSLGVDSGEGASVGGCQPESDMEHLLEELGLSKYLPVFRSAEVDLQTLSIMSEQDFSELGVLKGPRVRIMHHIGSR